MPNREYLHLLQSIIICEIICPSLWDGFPSATRHKIFIGGCYQQTGRHFVSYILSYSKFQYQLAYRRIVDYIFLLFKITHFMCTRIVVRGVQMISRKHSGDAV